MRKNILTVFTFVFVFLLTLTGCGSTSNSGEATTVSLDAVVEMQENQIVVNGKDFTLVLPFTKNLDDTFHVELSNFNLIVSGCDLDAPIVYNPATLVFDGGLGTQEILNISGSFDQNCRPAGYTFNAIQTTTKDGETLSEPISFTDNASGLNLIAVPSEINISTDDTGRVLDLYLSDVSTNAPVIGQEITAQFLDPNNGTLDQYTATTDETGHVSFNYTRPDTFVVGDTFDITFDITFEVAGGIVTKQATISVTFVDADFDYTLISVTTPLLISIATQEEEISVYLVDSNNVGIGGKTLSIATITDGYGSVSSSTATTDASGKATFTYTAPDDLTNLIGTSTVTTLSFTENDGTISEDVTIMISSAAIISDYSLVNPAPTADINVSNQTAVLDIQLIHTVDGNAIPVIDARPCTTATNTVTIDCVIPEVIPREYGRISNAAGSNTGDGYVYFDFEGPESGTPGLLEFDVYYIDGNGEIAATNTLSVDVNIL